MKLLLTYPDLPPVSFFEVANGSVLLRTFISQDLESCYSQSFSFVFEGCTLPLPSLPSYAFPRAVLRELALWASTEELWRYLNQSTRPQPPLPTHALRNIVTLPFYLAHAHHVPRSRPCCAAGLP